MATTKYDKTSPKSILKFAAGLSGKSLAQVVELDSFEANIQNKGDFGMMIEKYYFEHSPGPMAGPDFPEAGVELKTTGVIRKRPKGFKAKERLVLGMIDFDGIVNEEFESSSLMKKCKLMLVLFYLYEVDKPIYDRTFVIDPILFEIPAEDLEIIRRDWEIIRGKVADGLAHEISEGDTFYLGACRKGSGGVKEKLRPQPFSKIGAKSRAFSFKPNYVNKMISSHESDEVGLGIRAGLTIEQATQERFRPFLGKSVEEIEKSLNYFKKSKNHKGFNHDLCMRMLSNGTSTVIELDKAGIEMKTIRLRKNGKPKESMSFPGFKFMEIIHEEWEDSIFFERINRKFLLVVFRMGDDGVERLFKVEYWNMPYADREEAQRVWEETKRCVSFDATKLPKQSESHVAHVRPKGRNGRDTLPTPQGGQFTKQCFWLNPEYIAGVVSNL
jgi:DNA mismatch repair protein MutH